MNQKLPYKELSLLLGVVIAAIIVGLFFMDNGVLLTDNESTSSLTSYTQLPSQIKFLFEKAAYLIK